MTSPYVDPQGIQVTEALGAAQYVAVPAGTPAGAPFTGRCALLGYSVQAGAAAGSFVIGDGSANPGLQVVAQPVPANSGQVIWFGDEGIELTRGLYISVVGANTSMTVYYQVLPQT